MSQRDGDMSQIKNCQEDYLLNGRICYRRLSSQPEAEAIGYHKNGRIFFKCPVINYNVHGVCKIWNEAGELQERKIFFRGQTVSTSSNIAVDSDTLTTQDIIAVKNVGIRRAFLEELGYERFLSQINHIVIDKEGDQELVKIDWHKEEEPICLVKVKCASTGVFYTLRVPPSMQTIKEAIAWTFGFRNPDDYAPDLET